MPTVMPRERRSVETARLALFVVSALLLAGSLLVAPASPTAHASPRYLKPRVQILDEGRVYFPAVIAKDADFKKPATVETSTVFGSIREWLEIKKRKLTDKDAEYHLLLKAANERFTKAVTEVQKSGSYDVIAEKGAIKCENVTATDATQVTVDSIPAD